MEFDAPTVAAAAAAADGDEPLNHAAEDGGSSHHKLDGDEVKEESYLRQLLASNPTFADVLRDVNAVLLLVPTDATTAAVGNDDNPADSSTSVGDIGNPVSNSDLLEVSLRSHGLQLLHRVCDDDGNNTKAALPKRPSRRPPLSPALVELGTFWTLSVQLCRHLAMFASRHEKHLHLPAVRKLPFVLLEDVLDGLTLRDAKAFWTEWFVPLHPYLLKMDEGMPTATASSSNLVLLKTLNAFWKRCVVGAPSGGGGEWAATVLQALASSFPLGERSATRVWGSRNLETLSDFDTSDQYQQHVVAASAAVAAIGASASSSSGHRDRSGPDSATTSASEPTSRIDYSVYQSLWSLQQDFASPYLKNVGVFLARVRTVLEAMETTTPQLPASSEVGDGGASLEALASTGTFLTHARLLPYQLQDAEFRAIVLTQLLIVVHHVSSEAPGVGTQLEDSRQRAVKLLSLTHPELLSAIQYVLRISEPKWSAWKKNKFPDIAVKPRKRPTELRPPPPPTSTRSVQRLSDAAAAPPLLDLRAELPEICAPLQAPTLERHLVSHEYIEALDPEAGIEDEYHPKSDPYFCWQALRLLPVGDLEKVHFRTGDFEAAVRHIWKRDRGIEIPVAGHDDAMDEEESAESANEPESGSHGGTHDSQEMLLEQEVVAKDTPPPEPGENVNGGEGTVDANEGPMDAPQGLPAHEDQETADMDVVDEKSASPTSNAAGKSGDDSSQAAEEPEPNSRNGGHSTRGLHKTSTENQETVGLPNAPLPLRRSSSSKPIASTDSTESKARSLSSDRTNARGHTTAPTRNMPGWSPPLRDTLSEKVLSKDSGGAEGYRAAGPANRNRTTSFADRPRQPPGPQTQDAGRRGPTDEVHTDGFDGQGRRGGNSRGAEGGTEISRDERNGGQGFRDGGGRGQPHSSWEDRGAHRGRDDRGPRPGRGGDRGPLPSRDDRGPTPRRDERGGPQPSIGGGPPQSNVARDDRGSHAMGRRDDRGPPPSSTDAERDERNGPTHGRRDDRWNRGDRVQDRRDGGRSGGRGEQRGLSQDGPRPRR